MESPHSRAESRASYRSLSSAGSNTSKVSAYWEDSFCETGPSIEPKEKYDYSENGVSPRKGGPKLARINKVKMMETGRYVEAAKSRGEIIGDPEEMFSLRIDNLFHLVNLEGRMRLEFEVYGALGDVYQPINKNATPKAKYPFCFVRFYRKADMETAMIALQGKMIEGRAMRISEAGTGFQLQTSVY